MSLGTTAVGEGTEGVNGVYAEEGTTMSRQDLPSWTLVALTALAAFVSIAGAYYKSAGRIDAIEDNLKVHKIWDEKATDCMDAKLRRIELLTTQIATKVGVDPNLIK
jgi:hypothetical protein